MSVEASPIVAVGAAFAFAVIEAALRLHIMQSLPGTVTSLVLLTIGDTGKYLAFAIAGACAAVGMLAHGGILGRLAGIACTMGQSWSRSVSTTSRRDRRFPSASGSCHW